MKKGYIEGYYGRLFSKEEREMIINHMGNLKMDFYISITEIFVTN